MAESAAPASGEAIVVTGSRISRNGYEMPTPVTAVGTEELEAAAPANLADYVNQLPAVSGGSTPSTSQRSLTSGGAGLNTVSMRNLGPGRTLILAKGQPPALKGDTMLRSWIRTALWKRVLAAVMLGVGAGVLLGEDAQALKWIGDLFIRAIKMLVVPLIFFSLVSGVAALGDIGRLGRIGGRTLLLFLLTAFLSVSIGIGLAAILRPGDGLQITPPAGSEVPPSPDISLVEMIVSLVPENPVMAMAEGNVLAVLVFAVLFGVALLTAGKDGAPLVRAFDAGSAVMQRMTLIVMELTPFGVFALMAWVTGTFGFDALLPLGELVLLTYFGCGIILLGVYPLILRFIARIPLVHFYRGMVDAQAVAFSTASSNAALPVTLRCVERNLGVSNSIASFTVGLGATINMNGTAMFLGAIALFGAQAYGVELSWMSYVIIALTSTLGAIGTAGVPGAALIMMGLVLSSIGVPLETIAFVAGINHLLDMMRTMTNVTGDAAVAVAVGRMAGDLDVNRYISADDV